MLFCELEKFRKKFDLQKRFAAADGNSAVVFPIGTESPYLIEKLTCRPRRAAARPRLGVMAVFAAKCAALHKNHKSDARAVYKPEAFKRMNVAFYFMASIIICHNNAFCLLI